MMKMSRDREWLRRRAEAEDDTVVSLGGWVTDLARTEAAATPPLTLPPKAALVRLLQLSRRQHQLTLGQFARKVEVEVAELLRVEEEEQYLPTPGTVHKLAEFLRVPKGSLMALAGPARPQDARLDQAAARFVQQTLPVQQLTPEEQGALEEFVGVLSQR